MLPRQNYKPATKLGRGNTMGCWTYRQQDSLRAEETMEAKKVQAKKIADIAKEQLEEFERKTSKLPPIDKEERPFNPYHE